MSNFQETELLQIDGSCCIHQGSAPSPGSGPVVRWRTETGPGPQQGRSSNTNTGYQVSIINHIYYMTINDNTYYPMTIQIIYKATIGYIMQFIV